MQNNAEIDAGIAKTKTLGSRSDRVQVSVQVSVLGRKLYLCAEIVVRSVWRNPESRSLKESAVCILHSAFSILHSPF